jgi:hypothetical protein
VSPVPEPNAPMAIVCGSDSLVAATVVYLASDQARHGTDASLFIDGGQTLRRGTRRVISAPDLTQ